MDKDLKKLIIQSILGIIIVLVLIILLGKLIHEPILHFSKLFVNTFGVLGVGFGILISDSLPAFMIPDAFLVFAVAGNLGDFEVIFFASLGSLIGGSNSYLVGRYVLPKLKIGRDMIARNEAKLVPYIEKYGIWAVVIAATTPLPYSWMSFLVGSFKMSYIKFMISSLTRIPRFAIYYYAIKMGWAGNIVFSIFQNSFLS
jgi:uncharacterized membrane protein YdjX (TVP38/TMEM64 family)